MDLILEIVSSNGQSLGAARRKVFGVEGGRIGRAPDCEWVLANPYVSRHHATIRWISGTYYIESTGENGVAVNAQQAMIPQRERRALKTGDRLFLDEYEISVVVGGAVSEPAAAALGRMANFAPSGDPLGDLAATARSPILVADSAVPSHELDPLKQLSAGAGGLSNPTPRPEADWNHTPGVLDQFTPPVVSPDAIPDDWDKTSFARPRAAVSDPLTPPGRRSPAAGGGIAPIPDDWDKTSFSRLASPVVPTGQPAVPPPSGGGGATGVSSSAPSRTRGEPLPLRPAPVDPALIPGAFPEKSTVAGVSPVQEQAVPVRQAPPIPQAPAPAQRGAAHTPAQQPPRAGGNLDLTDFLSAAGVDPAVVPAETARSLGLILRAVVQGVVEVLQARAEIKNQFRLPLTRIKTAENNPLKFAVNAEDAMNSLLGRRNPAYLGPVESFEDAFNDIRFHQMAMLAGMRAGFEYALKRFDPERLQEAFDKRVKRGGLLQMSSKSRYWELYADEFRELTADPDDAFKRLFGEVFASAYEQQLEELKRNRRKAPR